MSRNFAVAAFGLGLALLCISQSVAGGMGRGVAQRQAAAGSSPEGAAANYYMFCYGGNPHTAYFSPVFSVASTRGVPGLSAAYGHYLTQMGYVADGGQCIHANVRADASAAKMRQENELRLGRTIIETNWAGN
jgi:hypothetical protein